MRSRVDLKLPFPSRKNLVSTGLMAKKGKLESLLFFLWAVGSEETVGQAGGEGQGRV